MRPDLGLLLTAATLAVDAWTAEAVDALERRGVDVLLLKGPALTDWLYAGHELRPYADADLLVAPDRITDAEAVLADLGYVLRDPEGEKRLVSGPHAQLWWRPGDEAMIDLHRSLPGEVLAEAVVWPTLWGRAERMRVFDRDIAVLDPPSRALLVGLHAWHHGATMPQPLEDLERATAVVPEPVWAEAARVAEAVMALPQFAAGLRMTRAGTAIAHAIGLPSAETFTRLADDDLSLGLARLFAARGLRARAALARRELLPPREFMHWWAPWSRRSDRALVAAYIFRTGWLAAKLPAGLRDWRSVRTR